MTEKPITAVLAMARVAMKKHPEDIDLAVKLLRSTVVKAKLESAVLPDLLARAYRDLIHEARHHSNEARRKVHGGYGQPPKATPGAAVAAIAAESLLHTYYINGQTLGSITGEEIPYLIDIEQAKADGAQFNANLLTRLRRHVKGEKTVCDCVDNKQVVKMFYDLQKHKRTG